MRVYASVCTVALLLGASSVPRAQGQTTLYVDADAPGPIHDGSSWEYAYRNPQDALAVATAGTEIRVAQGVYMPDGAYTPVGGVHVPGSGDWTVSASCTFQGSATAAGNVIVEAGIALTIDTGAALNINFTNFHLLIKSGAKVVVKNGGKIF